MDGFNNYNVIFKNVIFIYQMVDGYIAFFFLPRKKALEKK
jgi:hypothetical protein